MTDNNMFTSKREIARFFKTSVNKIDLLISLGAPILKITPPHSTQAIYRAYLPALEQWMGYKGEADGLPDQTRQPTRESIPAGQA